MARLPRLAVPSRRRRRCPDLGAPAGVAAPQAGQRIGQRRGWPGIAWLGATALLLTACGGPEAPPTGPLNAPIAGPGVSATAETRASPEAGFDQAASADLLARGHQAESAGNNGEALRLYREAGLHWPENLDTWTALATLAERTHNRQEQEAATFMIDRVRLYPSDALYVQREVNVALRLYVADRRNRPDANPAQLAYAERLADFYDERYAARGTYQPLSQFANIENREIPAALLFVAGSATYLAVLIARGSGSN